MLKKLNQSRKLEWAGFACIFLLLLVCNILTPFLVDDFNYLYSFETKERITCVADIIPSMMAHAQKMNGRLIAHSFVQFFGMLPGWVFDIFNSAMFVLQIALILRVGMAGEQRNNLLTAAVFCAVWMYEPAFGQVNLWQDGAANYLWSVIFGLLFLIPFVDFFMQDKPVAGKGKKALFLISAFVAGAYSETVSAAVIFMAVLLLILDRICLKKKVDRYLIVMVLTAFVGYITIYLAPAQWANKSVEMSLGSLLDAVIEAILMYESLGFLIAAFVVLLILNISEKTDRKRILLALVFEAGSLAANFIMILAHYYPQRSAVGACILLICADAILAKPILENGNYKTLMVSALAVLMLSAVPEFQNGIWDIGSTYKAVKANESYLYESKENGDLDVELSMVSAKTKYSAVYDAKYLDTEDATSWPNNSMAKYYGVNSIIGVESIDE